jgi:hypothetical protein
MIEASSSFKMGCWHFKTLPSFFCPETQDVLHSGWFKIPKELILVSIP